MPRAATVPSGPAETRFTRIPCGPEVAGQVARDRLERRLGDAHPVVDRPGDGRVEVEPDDRAAAVHQRHAAPRPAPSTRTRSSGTRPARSPPGWSGTSPRARPRARTRSRAARRRPRPSASRNWSTSGVAVAGLLTSSSSTSTGVLGSRCAARSVIRLARPKLGQHDLGPSRCALLRAWNAIESFVMTPVISRRLPARYHGHARNAPARRSSSVEKRPREPPPRLGRLDHLVDEAGGRGDVRARRCSSA